MEKRGQRRLLPMKTAVYYERTLVVVETYECESRISKMAGQANSFRRRRQFKQKNSLLPRGVARCLRSFRALKPAKVLSPDT
jgi:hypothetical protein